MAYPGPTGADISQVPLHLRQAVIDAANRYNVPLQLIINQGLMESTWGRGPMSRPNGGIFQYDQTEQDRLNGIWGTNYNRANPLDNIEMSVRRMSDFARNEGAGRITRSGDGTRYDPSAWFMQRNRDNPIWEIGLGSHIGGMTGYLDLLAGFDTAGSRALGPHSANYVVRGMAGQTPFDQLSSEIQQRFDERVGVGDRPGVDWTGSGGIGSDARFEQQLRQGPGGILGQAEPWKIPGIINPEYGHYLQTLGLMPANLQPNSGTDFTNTTWNAPAGSQPGWWGPWGAPAVHNWAQEGVSHGYGDPIMSLLGNLNYQLTGPTAGMNEGGGPTPNIATAGIDLAHWIAQSLTGQAATSPPYTRPSTDMDIWDAAPGTTTGAPIYVPGGGEMQGPVWQPAGGTWGTPGVVSPRIGWLEQQAGGGQGMIFNPATMNWGTFAGSVGNQVEDYNRWYERVIGGLTPAPEVFNPVGPTEPSWGEDLATMYGSQPGRVGFGAALNPVFAGMYYSQIPTQVDIIHQQQMAALDYAMRHPTIGGWTQTNTGNYVPDPTYIPPPPGPTPGAINIYGQINPLNIPGQGGFNMLAQGASATGSMGGSHDQAPGLPGMPGSDTPPPGFPQIGQPPSSIGPAQGTVGGLDPSTWLRMYRGGAGPASPAPPAPPANPMPPMPPPGVSPGSDAPPPGFPQIGQPPSSIGPPQGTVGGLDPSTWLRMYRGGAAQPAPMPWQIGSTFAPQNMMF